MTDLAPTNQVEEVQQKIGQMSFVVSSYYHQLVASGLTTAQAFALVRDLQQHLFNISPDFNEPFMGKPI